MTFIFKAKIPPWGEVFPQIEDVVADQRDIPFCVGIPYGLQLQNDIWNPERLRIVAHVNSAAGHSFISHHGVGKKNEINIWNFSKEKQPGNVTNGSFKTIPTDLKFLHILFAQRRWVYVTYCTDLSMRIFSAKFHILSTTSVNKTVLSLAYNEIRDEIITGIAGGIKTWKFPIGQKDSLIPGQLISCSFTPFDWVMSLALDGASKQILAISDVTISMIDLQTHRERCFFQKKCDFSFTTCVFYNPASYFLTGDKNGSIRAWSTSLNSFPMVTQFLGHTAEITKLLVHPQEPLLVSSSLDKTIRIWNLDTCAQTFKLETGEEIIEMDLLSGDLLYYHSHHHVKIWSLNLFHSLFTALSSRILRWARVKSPGYPARVLVHAEDDGVRLVSPVHGYELTTVLPITTMTTDIVDVAHDPRQEKIYLLLGTREVLVFESDTNPCCAYQLWVPESADEGVCSLAMINAEFALHENEVNLKAGLLFAGHYDGQISLVSGKDVYMKENVQAHQGQVTFLRVSNSFTESPDNLASRDHLVSCGTDCTVRIWQLIRPEINRVSIQQVTLIKLLQSPRDLAMAGNTLCMAMADNNVIMCRVPDERKDKKSIFNTVKKSHEFLTHSKDERHTAPINGLSCCSSLGLFATSSEDHSVKIWNTENQLVREMCFDESLRGVCFANSRGDLLVGFQSHISVVTVINYLPPSYLEILSKMHFDNDPFEEHVQFNDMLKFWYDPERVPRMPLDASKRRSLERPEIKIARKKKKKEVAVEKPKKEEEEEELHIFEKRRRFRRLSTRVHVMMALKRLSTKSRSKTMDISQIIQSVKANVDEEATTKTDTQLGQVPALLESEKPTTEVYWPCAPDGYIPNSVVRSRIKPRRPPPMLIPRRKRQVLKQKEAKEEGGDDELQDKIRITDFWTLFTTMQKELVKTKISEESAKKKEQGRTKSRRRRGTERDSSKLGRRLPPRSKAGRQFSDSSPMELDEIEGEEEEPQETDEFLGKEEEEEEELEEEETDEEVTSEESPASSPEWSGTEAQESPEIAEVSDEEDEDGGSFEDIEFRSSSESEGTTSVLKLEITPVDVPLLTRIQRKEWYPSLERQSSHVKVEDVLDDMLKTLPTVDSLETIKDICEQFINVHREFGIPDDKMVEIQNRFIELTYNLNPSVRQAAVWALGELNVHRKDAYLTVVRRLIDDDKDTREEAKRVLKKLTGVDTMEGLSRLIITSGVVSLYLPCNDNAVLLELVDRIRINKWKKTANKTEVVEDDDDIDNLRTTLRRTPFKAKFRHPPKITVRTRTPRTRRASILEEPASLSNIGKLKDKMKESTLGCKLLQKTEPFNDSIISKGGKDEEGAEVKDDWCTEDLKMPQSREYTSAGAEPNFYSTKCFNHKAKNTLAISPEENTIISLQTPPVRDQESVPSEKTSYPQESKKQRISKSSVSSLQQAPSQPWNRWFDDKSTTGVSSTGHSQLLSLTQILKVMDCVTGLTQPNAMLLLLKMKRTKRIVPKQIAQEDGTIQKFYTMGDLLEVLCHMSPLAEDLASLAHNASKSKEKMLMNMRTLFRRESLNTLQRGNRVVINGIGRLPINYLEGLLDLRRNVFESINRYLGSVNLVSPGSIEESRSFVSLLKSGLWLSAILEPDSGEDDHFVRSNLTSRRKQEHMTIAEVQETGVARKKMDEKSPPIFEQLSLQHCLGPGTHGQRLFNSTLIRRRALSDFRLQSSKEARNFWVTSIPHRLSVHTVPSEKTSYPQESKKQRISKSRVSSLQQAPSQPWNRWFDDKSTTGVSPTRHSQLLSLTQILKVMDCVIGLTQPNAMLLLLKMKRTKRIAPKQIAQEDGTIKKFYTMGDLLEVLCHMSPLAEDLASLAHNASKSKEEMLMNVRTLFRRESLNTLQRGNRVVINGIGRLPINYLESLLDLRRNVFESINRYLGRVNSVSPGSIEESRSFVSLLKSGLWLSAMLEPDSGEDDHFVRSNLTSRRKQEHTTIAEVQETGVARKKMDEKSPPIFEQLSLQHCLGPGTHGQRLLNSTLIRRRALSDFRLQSSKEARNFVVTSIPHRLSVHTGKKIEGESHFGIMELTWRAGTPQTNDETPNNTETNSVPLLSGKQVELKEQYILDKRKQNSQPKIPKSLSVPPLSHRKIKPFVEKRLDMFRAVNRMHSEKSLTALNELITKNKNIIKKKFLDKNGNLIPGSFTDFSPSPNTATPVSFQQSPSALHDLNNDSVTSVKSGDSSERCSRFYDLPRDMTRDILLNELNKFHLPPIWK